MILFSKQYSKISRVSCVPKPSQISIRGLGIKYTLKPLQADLGVGISRFGARIVPSRGGERGPVASMGGGCQIIMGSKDLPSADMHSIAVTIVRLTPAPL
jgi:hypothetical protein